MPRMNGFQAAQEIRSLGYNGPLLIQSTDDASIAYLRKYGDQTVEYLIKGDTEALKQTINKHLKPA
ncbi:hypothetical protein HYV88_03185 [Candidatus Woesearchaeota archaeon]|nr:hypothetical protein [Candidatus Woesearchaeota archaeon]